MTTQAQPVAVYFCGYRQTPEQPDHDPLTRQLAAMGYRVVYCPITWFGPAPDYRPRLYHEWLVQARACCRGLPSGSRRVFVGFSLGAIVALAMALEFRPDALWLLSPMDVGAAARSVACTVKILVGADEQPPEMVPWAKALGAQFVAAISREVRGAGHNPLLAPYLEAISILLWLYLARNGVGHLDPIWQRARLQMGSFAF